MWCGLGAAALVSEVLNVKVKLVAQPNKLCRLEIPAASKTATQKLVVHADAAREFADRNPALVDSVIENIYDVQWKHLPFLGHDIL